MVLSIPGRVLLASGLIFASKRHHSGASVLNAHRFEGLANVNLTRYLAGAVLPGMLEGGGYQKLDRVVSV